MTSLANIKKNEDYDVFIGRPSIFGNPHHVGFCLLCQIEHTREEAVNLYKVYFYNRVNMDAKFKNKVLKLKDKKLGCFCSPKACHGNIIIDYINATEFFSAGWFES